MKTPKPDPGQQWVSTFAWPDKIIARLFPSFFRRYAPKEIQEQWAAYLEHRGQKRNSR